MCRTNKKVFEIMNILETPFKGLYIIETINFQDNRGDFQKLFNYDFFKEKQLEYDFKEFYYSTNKRNVLRGMHFQSPPHSHVKIVYVSKGRIKDVVLDIRKDSNTYNQYFNIELDNKKGQCLYIPKGFAHGFLSLEDYTIVNYAQSSCYSQEYDCGIFYNSFGFNWGIDDPIISTRDMSFIELQNFKSPF